MRYVTQPFYCQNRQAYAGTDFHEEVIKKMDKLITRKEAAKLLGISITTLDEARYNGLISYIQYVPNGCVYFTDVGLQEYVAKCTHRAKPKEKKAARRNVRGS